MGPVIAIVVAGGAGARMGGDLPKQFLPLAGRPVLDRALAAFVTSPLVDGIVLALPAGATPESREAYREIAKVLEVVEGGARRQESVDNALRSVPPDAEVVLVHDGVRPLVSHELIRRCVDRAREQGAAVPVVPVRDTLKEWDGNRGGLVTGERARWLRAQTPQAFRADILREAYRRAGEEGWQGTDDASLVERAGYPVAAVPGEDGNLKITVPEEMRMARGLLAEEPEFRIGLGGDAHRLVEGRDLWLGGVRLPHPAGLLGHSDGDVLLHAIADAIYGAIGEQDIGHHFPPGREETRGIPSRRILAHARGRMADRGFGLVGLDAVVVCEEPRIGPVAEALRESIASILGIGPGRVSVKGKTTEGMGFEGRGEGISAWAVVLLRGAAARPASREEGRWR